MKKYLVFGLLAAFIALITLPHNCGNRNDAIATGIKYDVYTAVSTVPAYYAKQRDARISKAIDINIKNWIAVDDSGYGYVYKEDDKDCAIMQVYEVGESGETLATSENTREDGTWQPLQT
ncbi:MAG: hypothetical protein LBG67_04485, partial [Campylobacteraceae bacterium]|nr:hypothetical protein [Campylobacteraceae bacterium]